jgi:hypothetical protein
LQRIVSQALRKERAERYSSVKELQLALQDLRHELDFAAEAQRRAESAPPAVATNPENDAALTESAGALPARWRIFAGRAGTAKRAGRGSDCGTASDHPLRSRGGILAAVPAWTSLFARETKHRRRSGISEDS